MKRVNLDTAPAAVKKFVQNLAVDAEGIELTLGDRVFCTIFPPAQLSEAEKDAYLADARRLLRQAQERTKGIPAKIIEGEDPGTPRKPFGESENDHRDP